ncbi:response regulator [Oligoflexia bacterium]|nr:response regulator [Oligoflexia bacterium]
MKKVLVVDDDPVIRLLITDYLSNSGYTVEVAESGESCIEWLKDNHTDVLLLDLIMPNMNGLEVLKNIRENPNTAQLRVVMLSANTDTEAVVDDNEVSANGYLQKPFDMREILKTFRDLEEK